MASFAKHLSTHLYFHIERNNRKLGNRSSQECSSGFTQSEFQHSSTAHRQRSWSIENPHTDMEAQSVVYNYPSHATSGFDNSVDISPRHFSPEHRGSIMDSDWPEDYFSYSPYLLTPDLSSKSRSRKRHSKRYEDSSRRYEMCVDDDYSRPMMGHPKSRPPEPSSPQMDRRYLPPTPHSSRGMDGNMALPMIYSYEVEQDCFIVPSHVRGRFLPYKHEMNTLEVSDPKVCIIIDFRENGAFASQDLPFPTTSLRLTPKEWLANQLTRYRKIFNSIKESQTAIEGILLMNVERHSQFPFVTYLVANKLYTDPRRIIVQLRNQSIMSHGSDQLQHTAGYEEVATIMKPTFDCLSNKPVPNHTGYIISAFRVFAGEDREKLEKNWLTWTGARQVYKCLPKHLGLKRLTFHKKRFPDGGITYVLLCECSTLGEHVTEALVFVDHLRARCCGYTALYRPVDVF